MRGKSQRLYTIGEVAHRAGVSPQAIRVWERRGYLSAERTDGGHRLFTEQTMRLAVERTANVKRSRSNAGVVSTGARKSVTLASTGARVRRARIRSGLSQIEAARRIGISRTFLAAIERGESSVSVQVLARMADVFEIPMSGFAPATAARGSVMRVNERPKTVLAGGVTWEELATPGHELEPAILIVPARQDSGGVVVRGGEIFVFLVHGSLTFRLRHDGEAIRLQSGDALTIGAGVPYAWHNETAKVASCIWVEQIGPGKVAQSRT